MCSRWIQGAGREGRGHRLFSVIDIKLCNEPNSTDISLLAKERISSLPCSTYDAVSLSCFEMQYVSVKKADNRSCRRSNSKADNTLL